MKISKILGLLFVSVLFALMMGCSDSGANTNTGETSTNTDETNGNSEGSGQQVTLDFFDWFDEESYMTEVITKFEEENPNIKINATFVPTNEYAQKLLVNMSAGQGLDVFATGTVGEMASYQSRGQLMDISEYINNDELSNISTLTEQFKIDGGVYSLPYRSGSWALYYNKDIFDEAGVSYPDDTWTWETYREVATQLTYEGENGKVWGSLNYQPSSTWWRVPANTAGYNNPMDPEHLEKFKEAAKFSYDLSYDDESQQPYSDLVGEVGKDYSGRFLQGNHAMMFNGEWGVEMLNSAMEEGSGNINYDVAPMPYAEGTDPRTAGSAAVAMVSKNSKHPEEAVKFISFLASEQAGEILASHGVLPAWQSDATTSAFVDRLEQPEHADVFFQRPVNSQVPVDNPLYTDALKIVEEETTLYFLQEKELEETFDTVQQRINDEVKN